MYRIAPCLFIYFKPEHNWLNQLIDDNLVVKKRKRGRCMLIEKGLGILWNGDCTFCCGDFDGKIKLGNIHQNSIEEILSGDKVTAIKRDNQRLIMNQEVCQICRGSLYDKKTNRKIARRKLSILAAIKATKLYYSAYGPREFLKKVLSKLA
jgi:radical SAM protein with 4Fe4S-binding SPASM domain